MKPFSLLVKPASADCNLRCAYCFYLDRQELYPHTRKHRMSDEVLEKMIASYMATRQPQYSFGWQGGEPTLMGLDFFKRVTELQRKHGRAGAMVGNGLQTNGILIDDEFAQHLAENHFLIGLSIDGPADIHDTYRVYGHGGGSHADVMKTMARLKRYGVEYNVLTLVNNLNVKKPLDSYHYLCDLGVLFHQYIECIEFDSEGKLQPFAVTPEEWGEFLCAIFDEWYKNDTRRISVRLFDSILSVMLGQPPTVCAMGNDCRQYFVVEHNGDVYPCDFFVRPELKLGNVLNDDWLMLQKLPMYEQFGARKRQRPAQCETCPYVRFCAGDCPKNRPGKGDERGRLSTLCKGWMTFYEHTLDRFAELAAQVQKENQAREARQAMPQSPPAGKIGRNDPCPCGSGKKYKRCCGAAAARRSRQ